MLVARGRDALVAVHVIDCALEDLGGRKRCGDSCQVECADLIRSGKKERQAACPFQSRGGVINIDSHVPCSAVLGIHGHIVRFDLFSQCFEVLACPEIHRLPVLTVPALDRFSGHIVSRI